MYFNHSNLSIKPAGMLTLVKQNVKIIVTHRNKYKMEDYFYDKYVSKYDYAPGYLIEA